MIQTITTRRAAVVGLVSVLVLFSGCSAVLGGGEESETELGDVTVENSDETARTIHVLVERGSEPAYGTTVELDGVSPPANESDFGSIDSAVLDDSAWDGDAADWTIYTRVDANSSWEEHALPAEGDSDCYAVRLEVESNGSVTSFTPDCASWPPTSGS